MGHADYGSYLLRQAEQHEDDMAQRAAVRDNFISREASALAEMLTNGRHDTLVPPLRALPSGRKLVPLSEEFVEFVNDQYNDNALETLAGVLFRRQGQFDRIVREFALEFAEWEANTELGD